MTSQSNSSMPTKRVLSMQSHVVWGYVGNKAATFPLQVLGFDVDAINSVQFSNHTGYPVFKGTVLDDAQFLALLGGLESNHLLDYSHLLSGYMGSVSALQAVKTAVQRAKQVNPNAFYVMDPVMGDDGKLYVPKDVIPVYQKDMLHLADIITPNQFEAELLTGIQISSPSDALKALQALHSHGVANVIITSVASTDPTDTTLVLYGSSQASSPKSNAASPQMFADLFCIRLPKLEGKFTGTGDLFAALTVAHTEEARAKGSKTWLRDACEKTIATMQSVLKRTLEFAYANGYHADLSQAERVRLLELRLVQSKRDMEEPVVSGSLQAQTLSWNLASVNGTKE